MLSDIHAVQCKVSSFEVQFVPYIRRVSGCLILSSTLPPCGFK